MGLLHRKKRKRLEEMEPTQLGKVMVSTLATTSKQLVWLFALNGVLWIWCSYILAFMDKIQIAESLSSNVCNVVIGQLVCYLITSTIENIAKYSGLPWEAKNRFLPDNKLKEDSIDEQSDIDYDQLANAAPD